jgi:hypothetical protein
MTDEIYRNRLIHLILDNRFDINSKRTDIARVLDECDIPITVFDKLIISKSCYTDKYCIESESATISR